MIQYSYFDIYREDIARNRKVANNVKDGLCTTFLMCVRLTTLYAHHENYKCTF